MDGSHSGHGQRSEEVTAAITQEGAPRILTAEVGSPEGGVNRTSDHVPGSLSDLARADVESRHPGGSYDLITYLVGAQLASLRLLTP